MMLVTVQEIKEELIKTYGHPSLDMLKLAEKLIRIYEYRLDHIRSNTQCIGLDKCHVDGNCTHCLADTRQNYVVHL